MSRGAKAFQLGSPLSMKNKIINGCMRLAQRGTSFVTGNYAAYTLDRWVQQNSHDAGNITTSRDTSIPNNNFQYSLKVTNAAGNDTSIGAAQFALLNQRVEGYNIVPLRSGIFSLSFWVRSSKTGIYCVSFVNAGQDRSYVCEYTINTANTWEYKTVFCDLSAVSGGTWNYEDGIGLTAWFSLACGSTYQTTKDVWQTGVYLATANQVNWLNETSNTFYLTGVQLEAGGASSFEVRDFGDELRLGQRYYTKMGFELSGGGWPIMIAYFLSGNYTGTNYNFPVRMRAVPVVTKVGTWTVNNCAQPVVGGWGQDGFMLQALGTNTTMGYFYAQTDATAGVTADAEL
jgi:hypothetical protein